MSLVIRAARCQKPLDTLPHAGHSGKRDQFHTLPDHGCLGCEVEALRLENKELRDTLEACDEFLSRTPMLNPGQLAVMSRQFLSRSNTLIQKLTAAKEGGE